MINMASATLQYNNIVNIVPPNNNAKKNRRISVSCPRHFNLNYSINKDIKNPSGSLLVAARSSKISSLHNSQAAIVTKDSWERSILQSELPVLVEFYASWCGPCKMVHRIIDEIAAEYTGKLKCFMINTDNDPQMAEEYDIKVVPVVVLIKNGAQCESIAGTMPKEFYVAAIERVLKS